MRWAQRVASQHGTLSRAQQVQQRWELQLLHDLSACRGAGSGSVSGMRALALQKITPWTAKPPVPWTPGQRSCMHARCLQHRLGVG